VISQYIPTGQYVDMPKVFRKKTKDARHKGK